MPAAARPAVCSPWLLLCADACLLLLRAAPLPADARPAVRAAPLQVLGDRCMEYAPAARPTMEEVLAGGWPLLLVMGTTGVCWQVGGLCCWW